MRYRNIIKLSVVFYLMDKKDLDYLFVLKALNELPFNVGRKLLVDFLTGKEDNQSISRNKLHTLKNFKSLSYNKNELNKIIDNLILNNMINEVSLNDDNKFVKLLELSIKGKKETKDPTLHKRKLALNFNEIQTEISEEDKKNFQIKQS